MNTLEFGTNFDRKITSIELDSADTTNFLNNFYDMKKCLILGIFSLILFTTIFYPKEGGGGLTDNFVYQVRAGGIFLVYSPWKEM